MLEYMWLHTLICYVLLLTTCWLAVAWPHSDSLVWECGSAVWCLCLLMVLPMHIVFPQRKPGSHSEVFVDLLEKLTVVVSSTVRMGMW